MAEALHVDAAGVRGVAVDVVGVFGWSAATTAAGLLGEYLAAYGLVVGTVPSACGCRALGVRLALAVALVGVAAGAGGQGGAAGLDADAGGQRLRRALTA